MIYFNELTIDQIRRGYYTAVYFNRTKEILLKENNFKRVTMQIFQKKEGSILCGVEEVRELLKEATGYFDPPSSRLNRDYGEAIPASAQGSGEAKWVDKSGELEILALKDGERISPWESVMHIKGPYAYFAHLESIYLGILARRTLVATNTGKCVEAAGGKPSDSEGKPVIFFADRFDYFLNQTGDGYAAKIGGASTVCTQAMTAWTGADAVGTIPHSLIAVYGGNTLRSAELFHKYYPEENLIVLVDFNNDCLRESLSVARKLGEKLWAVRLDTAGEMIDKSFQIQNSKNKIQNSNEIYGVNPYLVRAVREALDNEGFSKVKIIVSGGFYPEKIAKFVKEKVPVDGYGVGSALVHGENDFTADVVEVEGQKLAKAGREYKQNKRFKKII